MKALFIITCLLFSTIAYAQESYKRCLDGERTKWSIMDEIPDLGKVSHGLIAYEDTTINNTSYKKFYWEESINFEDTTIQWQDRIDLAYQWEQYYVRETTDASQLYIYDAYLEKEYLVSDMNLAVGDTFPIPEIWENIWTFWGIDSLVVDSVYEQNGLKHIRFNHQWMAYFFSEEYFYTTFIEGIGPNIGMLSPLGQVLNCFQNQSIYWKNEYVSYPCGYFDKGSSIDFISSVPKYSIHLNEENISIFSSIHEPVQLTLYNTMGKVCYTEGFSGNQQIVIPVYSLPHGIYLLKIENNNRKNFQVIKLIL